MNPEEMYRLHRDRVYRLCLRFCGGQVALAEDLTQDVFIKMLEGFHQLTTLDALEPWLYRVTTNACFTRLKRENSVWNKVKRSLMSAEPPAQTSPEKQLHLRQDLQLVMDGLAALPPQERVVFCMHVLDELPQREICQILSLSKGYVSKLLKRARQKLQQELQQEAADA